jgi:hypothetical protein
MRLLQLLTALGLLAFWAAFFTVGFSNEAYPDCYETFEHSFPLPDAFIAFILLLAWNQGSSTHPKAIQYTRIAGGAMIFLGLCDFSFNLMNGMYSISTAELLMNGFINIWCLGFGAYQAFRKLEPLG